MNDKSIRKILIAYLQSLNDEIRIYQEIFSIPRNEKEFPEIINVVESSFFKKRTPGAVSFFSCSAVTADISKKCFAVEALQLSKRNGNFGTPAVLTVGNTCFRNQTARRVIEKFAARTVPAVNDLCAR